MKRIFIGYRREDTKAWVHKVGPQLATLFPRDRVFFDLTIPPGANFRTALDSQLARCDVALIVIGPRWLGSDNPHNRRIDAPNDFVRIEVERLIDRHVPILPVLVDGAQMPTETELPQSIAALADLQAVTIPDQGGDDFPSVIVDALLGILRQWKAVEILDGDTRGTWSQIWFDTAWLTETEGWLCGAIDIGGAGGHVGHGILLTTTDAGATWRRATHITAGRGEFSWGGYRYNWTDVGPIRSILLYARRRAGDQEIVNGYIATATGIYRAAAPRAQFTDDIEWQRSTPMPDGKRPYAFFSWLEGIEGDNELYASGWLGIANWIRNSEWNLQKEAFTYEMAMVANAGGSDGRNVWAVGINAEDDLGNRNLKTRQSLFHLEWPANEWQPVSLDNVQLEERQNLTGVWVDDRSRVFVVGDGGLLIQGVRHEIRSWTWRRLPVPTTLSLRRIVRNELGLWIVGDQGTILNSLDDGNHWTVLNVPDVDSPLHNVRFFGSRGWILGNKVVLKLEI
jgi:hypothetical protein